jgi:hypothetical protein
MGNLQCRRGRGQSSRFNGQLSWKHIGTNGRIAIRPYGMVNAVWGTSNAA